MTEQKNWQSAINSQLSQRLIRPLIQPGIISFAGATEIIQRSQRFSSRHPLLNNPRWSSLKNLEGEKVPIVHAQMAVPREAEVQQMGAKIKETPIVQAKRIIESKQALENKNKLNYSASQPISSTETSISQSPKNNSSNVVIQRKLDSSAPQSQSQAISSSSILSKRNTEESTSLDLDGEISSPAMATPPVSDVVIPTSPLLPDTETIFSQQKLSNNNLPNQNTNAKDFFINNRESSKQQKEQQVSVEENSQLLSKHTNESPDGETSEVINPLPVVKSINRVVAQENSLPQLAKNKLETDSKVKNYLLPVVQSHSKTYSGENNSTQLSEHKQFNYPSQQEVKTSNSVDKITEDISSKVRQGKLVIKEIAQEKTKFDYPNTKITSELASKPTNYNRKKPGQANILPIVNPKPLTSFQSSSTKQIIPSQPQRKSVVVNPQQIKSPEMKTPLIFSQGATRQQTQENNNKRPTSQPSNYPSATNDLSQPKTSETIVNQWLVNQNQQKHPDSQPQQNIDLNAITNQVERRLKRRLIAESERRGRKFR